MSNLPQLCYYTSTSYISNIHDDCVVFVSTGWYAEYAYDANGSLTADANKGISSFTWNEIGLPKTVTFSDGSSVSYLYAADGTKLREIRTVSGSSTTLDWCGGLALEQLGSGTRAAKRLRTGAGYVDLSSGVTALRYQVLDHLGSVRAVVGASGTVLETDDYYPLGGPLDISSASVQPEKFQRKEWNTAKAFNTYDFGARLYDPALGRWLSQDPLAEQYYPHSPYLFCAGNPMKFVDPTGKSTRVRKLENGTYEVTGGLVEMLIRKVVLSDHESNRYFQNVLNCVIWYPIRFVNFTYEFGMSIFKIFLYCYFSCCKHIIIDCKN